MKMTRLNTLLATGLAAVGLNLTSALAATNYWTGGTDAPAGQIGANQAPSSFWRTPANSAAERREMVAHGVSRGERVKTAKAPSGAIEAIPPADCFRRYAARFPYRCHPRLAPWATISRCSAAFGV